MAVNLPTRPLVIAAAAGVLSLGLGAGALLGDDGPEIAAARAEAARLEERLSRANGQERRLRTERDQLEATLAARRAPVICPQEYVSTLKLLPHFSVDHPCGWHVVYNPAPAPPADRDGLLVEIVFFSRVPVSLAPRTGALADIELAQWTDDPSDDRDALAPLGRWIEEERARFAPPPREDRFEGGSGATVFVMDGVLATDDDATPAVVALWSFEDTSTGARHVMRAVALRPNARAREAIERMARSFTVFPR